MGMCHCSFGAPLFLYLERHFCFEGAPFLLRRSAILASKERHSCFEGAPFLLRRSAILALQIKRRQTIPHVLPLSFGHQLYQLEGRTQCPRFLVWHVPCPGFLVGPQTISHRFF